MKQFKNLYLLVFLFLLASCATNSKFPVSSVVPAANITAKKGLDKQKNYTLEITTNNLESADRMDPPGNNYSIWITTRENGVKNIGQLTVKNAEKNIFKTVTPFDFDEIFITVEDQGNLQYPHGIEIARTKI